MSQLTVGWSRAENAADLPQDSLVVFPERLLTVGWKPMLNASVLDWVEDDLLVPPGGGPDPEPTPAPQPPAPAPAPAAQEQAQAHANSEAPPKPDPPGAPIVRVTARRTMSLFKKDGLIVDVTAPVDATVRAVLMGSVTQMRGGKLVGPRRRKLSRTKTVDAKAKARTRLVLPISNDGRRAIGDYETLKTTLQVVATYEDGRKLAVERRVVLARTALKASTSKARKRR